MGFPTPRLNHLTSHDYEHIYEPSEDTFILLDALERDASELQALKPTICLEIGSGSGCVTAFVASVLGTVATSTDINDYAVKATLSTGRQNQVEISSVRTSFTEGLSRRIKGNVDLLLFNPPYVSTTGSEVEEAQDKQSLSGSWAGGRDGMHVTNQLLAQVGVLISRLYRTDLKRSIADVFRIQVISNSDVRSPIITLGSTSFFHVRVNNVYIMAVTKNNANAALVFEFIYKFMNIGRSYFGKVDEESVRNNFVLIYELIDEILDFGFPQNSEIDTLKMYITTEGVKSEQAVRDDSSKITIQATGSTSWRRNDIKYKKNEAFVDVVESVNLLMSSKGTVLRADVDGHVMMRAYLSGTPECKFGLNDKLVLDKNDHGGDDAVELDDCQFHQCVRLGKFDADRSITFVPPDGEFELMKYRSTRDVNLPLKVIPTIVEQSKSKVEYTVSLRTNFNIKLSATEVALRIPTPLNATQIEVKATQGKAKYVPAENVILWKIPRMQGGSEATLTGFAELTATTNRQAWARPPIDVDFQVLMLTASGLSVRFLKVFEKSNYHSVKWVRYLTKASGTYQVRI
ncbi:hypothetical protein FRB98_000200 [Tulasnella sp. 332]|nr:hypothetical protein FRB98_000200 [Tulasnella sp. 332]